MSGLPANLVELHESLDAAGLPHAFGGALALAWCTQRARGTIDIDLNVFVDVSSTDALLVALPDGVERSPAEAELLRRDGQVRLWWQSTPVDLFLNTTPFHEKAATRARHEPFAGTVLPFLGCDDLAVFKAFFNRTKDWADLEDMAAAGTLDADRVVGVIARYLGPTDERIPRLQALSD